MTSRLAHLDALRGFAALAVVTQHVFEKVDAGPVEWVNLGRLGVLVFFLLSGFVVPFSLDKGSARFVRGRAARLLPALWLSVAVMLLLRHADAATVAANLTMTAGPLGFDYLNPVYWTLTYEVIFYLICLSLFGLGRLHCPRTVGIFALLAVAIGLLLQPLLFFGYLFGGLLLRMALVEGNATARPWAGAAAISLTAAAAWVGFQHEARFLEAMPRGIAMLLAVPLFLGVLVWRPQPPRVALWLGAISYPVYLFGDPVLRMAAPLQSSPALFVTVVITATVGLGWAVHALVERRFMAAATSSPAVLPRPVNV